MYIRNPLEFESPPSNKGQSQPKRSKQEKKEWGYTYENLVKFQENTNRKMPKIALNKWFFLL